MRGNVGAWTVYGQIVRIRREELGLTMAEVAERMTAAGVETSSSFVQGIEASRSVPNAEGMLALNYVLYGDATFPGAMIPTLMAMGLWKERR